MSETKLQLPPAPVVAKKPKPYPFWLGGVAAAMAASITHPLDLTKVRLQATGDKGMIQSMRKTIHTAGIRGLYDGLTGTLLRQMTYSVIRFAVFDEAKAYLHTTPGPAPAWKLALAGSIAGGVAGILGNPAELMMVRMQADKAKPPEKRYNYRNSVQGLYTMARTEGILSWWRGWVPNTIRSVLMNMTQLGAYDWFKSSLLQTGWLPDGSLLHFLASLGAGTVATAVTSPADVIKARIMNASKGNTSVAQVLRESITKEGPRVLFKGFVPAWIRLQPTTTLIFLILEQLKSGVDRYRASGGTLL